MYLLIAKTNGLQMENLEINKLRQNYTKSSLIMESLLNDPIAQFKIWFDQAINYGIKESNAFALSTVSHDGSPSSRIVLLKDIKDHGFVFYTNVESDKAKDIDKNPNIAMLFFWKEMERQVRIKGTAIKIADQTAIHYFQSRPKGSQIAAWASRQSQVIDDRSVLNKRVEKLQTQYADEKVLPKPPYWGGYILIPLKLY